MNNTQILLLIIGVMGLINILLYRLVLMKRYDEVSYYTNRGIIYDMTFLTIWFGFGFLIVPYIIIRFFFKWLRIKLKALSKKLVKYL